MKRKRAIKLSVIVTAVLALVILSGAACYAANDISKTNVTGLSIENVDPGSVLESGSTQKVKLTFRDNDSHAIENGDQITVSWPESSAAAYFEGYNKTIPLKAKTNSGEIAVGFTGYGRYDRYGPMDFRPFTECLGSVLCLVSAKKEQLINACSGSVQAMFIRR